MQNAVAMNVSNGLSKIYVGAQYSKPPYGVGDPVLIYRGQKIKTLAQVLTWLGIVASVFGGIVLIVDGGWELQSGLLVMVGGALLSWLGSLTLYGFGQLIENTEILVRRSRDGEEDTNPDPESSTIL